MKIGQVARLFEVREVKFVHGAGNPTPCADGIDENHRFVSLAGFHDLKTTDGFGRILDPGKREFHLKVFYNPRSYAIIGQKGVAHTYDKDRLHVRFHIRT